MKAEDIEEIADACFARLKSRNFFKGLIFDDFIDEITDFYCVTNKLHPFREGNGRTQRVFLAQLALRAGYELDFANMDTDKLMLATIHAANAVDSYLRDAMYEIITPI